MGLLTAIFGKAIEKEVVKRTNALIAPALTNLFNQNVYRWVNDGTPIIEADGYDYISNGFSSVGAVFECVDILVKKVVSCPRIVYRIKDQKEYKKYLNYSKSQATMPQAMIAKAKGLEEVHHAQIQKLLDNPNPKINGDDTIETLAGLFLLTGNSYLYGNNSAPNTSAKWSEAWAVPSPMMIKSGGWMEPIKEYVLQYWQTEAPFPAKQIKHFKTFNPDYTSSGSQLYGVSPLRAYLYSLDIIKNSKKQADKQIKNGGKLGFLTPENREDNLGQPQIDQIGDDIRGAHGSTDELSRIIPASIALKWTEIGLSSADLQLLEMSGASADDIYRAYHIPLQFRSQDSSTYNNLPVANRQLVYNAVAPITRKLDVGLTEFYCTPYNTATEKYVIHLDYASLPELNDDMKSIVSWLEQFPWLTPNEKREVIGYGRGDADGLDEIFINRNMVRLSDVMEGKIDQSGAAQQASDNNTGGALGNNG